MDYSCKKGMSLEEQYIISRWLYSLGFEGFMSDAEYNNLHRYMKAKLLLPEYVNRAWSSDPCPVALLLHYGLEEANIDIMLSDRSESIPSLQTELEVKEEFGDMSEPHYVSFKHDGFNVKTSFNNSINIGSRTRGRASDAIKLQYFAQALPKEIPVKDLTHITGEVTLSPENFKKLCAMFPKKGLVSTRSAVRTALAHKESAGLVTFTAFDIDGIHDVDIIKEKLESWGFKTPNFVKVNNYDELIAVMHKFNDMHAAYPEPTDGLVVRVAHGDYKRAVRIWSWEEAIKKSFVLGPVEAYGSHQISMKVSIYPIKLENSTQRLVSVTNLSRLISNYLFTGYPIAFKLTSDATAVLEESVTRVLQKQYDGNYEAYQEMIVETENAKNITE